MSPGARISKPWRGVIRHVQSNQERRFTRMAEALDFMHEFLDLNEGDFPVEGLTLSD